MSAANIIPTRQPIEHPDATAARHAKTLDEIRGIQQQNMLLADELSSAQRTIQQLQDRIELLVTDNSASKREAKIYMRKTVELATAMTNIGLLTRKAEEVVMSAGELLAVESDEEAAAETAAAQEAVRKLPLASVADQVEQHLKTI